jgi:hypothetical protein
VLLLKDALCGISSVFWGARAHSNAQLQIIAAQDDSMARYKALFVACLYASVTRGIEMGSSDIPGPHVADASRLPLREAILNDLIRAEKNTACPLLTDRDLLKLRKKTISTFVMGNSLLRTFPIAVNRWLNAECNVNAGYELIEDGSHWQYNKWEKALQRHPVLFPQIALEAQVG